MSIYLSIIAAAGNEVQQSQVGASLTKSLTISEIHDTDSGALNVADFNYEWYFVDKPTGSSVSIDDSSSPANKSTVLINSIDTWGTYRIFVIATNIAIPSTKSGTNPLSADERNFVNIAVKSTNNSLEKPAAFQRNWKEKYDKLVDVVDNTQKSINSIKISNSLTLTLPSTDGTSGQILITDGQGNLSFNSVSAAELSNVSLESLTNVSNSAATNGQVLTWDSSINSWKPETSSGGGITLSSFSVGAEGSPTTNGSITYNSSNGVFTYSPQDLTSYLTSFDLVDDTTPQLGGNLECQAFDITTTGKIKFSNVYTNESDLPSASTYHGMFAHVHSTSKAYFAHGGNWIKLIAETGSTTDNLAEGSSNLYYTDNRSDIRANLRIAEAKLQSLDEVRSDMSPTDGQVLKWDNSNNRWDAANDNSGSGGSATDNINEGNSKVETVDTGSDGSVNFYTEVSSDSSVFSSIPTPVWKMDESGNLKPGKTDTFNLGFYDSTGNASDNRQINKIHVNKVYSNGSYFRIPPAMSSSDFKLNAVHDTMSQTYDIPFYDSSTSPSSTSGHILVKNLNESIGPHNWIPWKLKLPSSFSYNANSVMVTNSSVDELTWEKTDLYKTKEWSNMHSDEWTTETSYSSSYTGVVGKSIFIFAFKNITGKTINITKASLSCLEMYSSKIYWTLVGASDNDFKTNKGASLISEQTMSIVNQDNSSPYSGIGQSEAVLSNTIGNGLWVAFLITNMTSSSSNNKSFVANLTYTLS